MFIRLVAPTFSIPELSTYLNRPHQNVSAMMYKQHIKRRNKSAKIDINKKYGKLQPIKRINMQYKGKTRAGWLCSCDCGNVVKIREDSIISGRTNTCGCGVGLIGNKSPKWEGYEEISGSHLLKIKRGAAKRSIKFNISIEDIWDKFIQQNRKCKLTNLDIYFAKTSRDKFRNETTASLDRIDSNLDYDIDNVQWVHRDINKMKWELKEDYFVQMCGLVYKNLLEEYDDKTNDWW